jgi:hypothetical protein
MIRWLLLLPATIISWYVVMLAGLFGRQWLEQMLCPANAWVSGFCHDSRVAHLLYGWQLVVLSAVSACVVVLVASAMAPSRRRLIAVIALVCGGVVAATMTWPWGEFEQWYCAVAGGVVGLAMVVKLTRRATVE